jgi:hypothetical protein
MDHEVPNHSDDFDHGEICGFFYKRLETLALLTIMSMVPVPRMPELL